MRRRLAYLVAAIAGATALAAAGAPGGFALDPSQLSAHVGNPWLPLRPGTTSVYRGVEDGEPARDVPTVMRARPRLSMLERGELVSVRRGS